MQIANTDKYKPISKDLFINYTKYESSYKTYTYAQYKQILFVLDKVNIYQHYCKRTNKSTYFILDKR